MANPLANTSTRVPKMVVFDLGMLFSNFLLYFKDTSIVSNTICFTWTPIEYHRIFNSLMIIMIIFLLQIIHCGHFGLTLIWIPLFIKLSEFIFLILVLCRYSYKHYCFFFFYITIAVFTDCAKSKPVCWQLLYNIIKPLS